jgi:hypothetical protein
LNAVESDESEKVMGSADPAADDGQALGLSGDDFIQIYSSVLYDDDIICYVWDDTASGLNGTVTVYANGSQIYNKAWATGNSDVIEITPKDIPGIYDGTYDIRVVYTKVNGTSYSTNAEVYFDNICANPLKTTISASNVNLVYNDNKDLIATLKDSNGKPISGVNVMIGIMGTNYPLTTDKNGKIKQSLSQLPPKTHSITLTFEGSKFYKAVTKKVTVTVKKAPSKLTAPKKTFKKLVKTKKYTVTLKNHKNKAINKAKVTLKVKGKTYSGKTNAKGQVTFKITNLKKKGTYKAAVKFGGNEYNAAKTANPKIIVK